MAAQASVVGGMDTSTVASPPSATKPMTPTLKSPAKPHCRLSPSDMIAEMSPMFRIRSAVDQLWANPVSRISPATKANMAVFFIISLIPLSP